MEFESRGIDDAAPDYWQSAHDLELYEESLGERIGWKWEAVLDELAARGLLAGFVPPGTALLDWGCGAGVASRTLLRRVDAHAIPRVHLWDRSRLARDHAATRIETRAPSVEVVRESRAPESWTGLLLISHVLDELDDEGVRALLRLAGAAAGVLWVEPGSRRTSRRLSELRAELLATHRALAPCLHQAACGMLAEGNERHWCHLFGSVPRAAFTSPKWAQLKSELSLDLRSLPYSFLALQRNDLAGDASTPTATSRVLGRPRPSRGVLQLDLCRKDGIHSVRLLERLDRPLAKAIGKRPTRPWMLDADWAEGRITRIEVVEDRPEGSDSA